MDPPSQNEQTEAMQHSTDEVEETMSRSMKNIYNAGLPRTIKEQFEQDIRACTPGASGEARRRRSLIRQYRAYQVAHYPFAKEVELEEGIKAAEVAGNEELRACSTHAKLQWDLTELWRTETSSWRFDDTSSDEEGYKGPVGSRGMRKNANQRFNARKMSQVEKGISNLGLKRQRHNSNAKQDESSDLLRLEKSISGLDFGQVNDVNLSNDNNTTKGTGLEGSDYQNEDTKTMKMNTPASDEEASTSNPMGLIYKLAENQANYQQNTNVGVTDGNKNYANDQSSSFQEDHQAKSDTPSLAKHSTTGKRLNEIEGNGEDESDNDSKSSAAAHTSPAKKANTLGDADTSDLASSAPVSGHYRLHTSSDIELLETDKPTKVEISTTIELAGDAKDVEIDQNNECHLGSAATGAVTTLKAQSSQVVQAAEGSDAATEDDAGKDAPAAGLAADHAYTSSSDATEGKPDNEKSPPLEEAKFAEPVAGVMDVDDDKTMQNGKAAVPVSMGWLAKIRKLFYL